MALEIWNVTKSFDGKKALEVIPLSIPAGAMVGVIGRSGAGKSTLLRAVNRLHDVTSGKIVFNGDDVTAKKGADVRRWRARSAMIFQQFNLAGRLDVMMNVLLGRLSQVPRRARHCGCFQKVTGGLPLRRWNLSRWPISQASGRKPCRAASNSAPPLRAHLPKSPN